MSTAATLDLLPQEALAKAASCLKVMAHPVRLRIVDLLRQGDFAVAELAELCGIPQHQACGHLRLMQNCGLLTSERHGHSVHYKIASPQLPGLLDCIRKNCGTESAPAKTRARRSGS